LAFDGYELNDLANALGVGKEHTIDFTSELPLESGFKGVSFDSLENFLAPLGEDIRGYLLDEVEVTMDGELSDVDSLPEFNGTIIYNVNPVLQFNSYTNVAKQLERDTTLRGSAQFAAAARVSDGDMVEISFADKTIVRKFKLQEELKGTIALNPTFDLNESISSYRFQKSKIMRVNNE
jgi:NADH-quinone oxidoreductase subunit G